MFLVMRGAWCVKETHHASRIMFLGEEMMIKREKAVHLGDRASFNVIGAVLQVGDVAPDFVLTTNSWQKVGLGDYAGKIKLISVVPSLDTSVCDAQTRRFNEVAAGLDENVVVLTVSADLPFAQARWCGAAGVDRVVTLSDHSDMNFGTAYGTHIEGMRVDQRSVFVVDAEDKIVHAEYVEQFGNQPDYDAAIGAVKQALS
jgi:thiol peroxidase